MLAGKSPSWEPYLATSMATSQLGACQPAGKMSLSHIIILTDDGGPLTTLTVNLSFLANRFAFFDI